MQDIIPPTGWENLKSKPGSTPSGLGENRDMSPQETDTVDSGEVQATQDGEDTSIVAPEAQAIADEFGGEAPVVQGGIGEDDSGEGIDTTTVGGLGDTALDTLVGDAPEEGPIDAKVSIPDTALEHDLAEDVAYAEKPFRDAQIEKADKLTPENQELLDWLASEAADKAMSNYTEGKSQMTEAEAVIREKALPFGNFRESHENRDDFVETDFKLYEPNKERKQLKLERVERQLRTVVDLQIDKIMSDVGLTPAEQLTRITAVEDTRRIVRDSLLNRSNGGIYPEDLKALAEWGGGREPEQQPRLWGRFVTALAKEHGVLAVQALDMIAEKSGVSFGELFDQVAPMFVESLDGTQYQESTNNFLESRGYIWSNGRKRYVKYDVSRS